MSGFAISFGQQNEKAVNVMMEKIAHRGSYIQSIKNFDTASIGQNYLKADTNKAESTECVPVSDSDNTFFICYDGQINDCKALCQQFGIEEGPFLEERLILYLYKNKRDNIFDYLGNAIFAFVITDGKQMFAARDLLGIKTLFYSKNNDRILLSSELKSICAIDEDVIEFPAGKVMDELGVCTSMDPISPNVEYWDKDVKTMAGDIRDIIEKNIRSTVTFEYPTGGLLSGGMDSSVINTISSKIYKEKFGPDAKLKTFSIGIGVSGDILNARLMADYIGSDHYELLVTTEDLIEVLPDVIYHLENFDPSLVRSSVANYLISSYAAKEHGIEVLLSGEGGDEIFCGYTYLKQIPYDQMVEKQIECLGYLHNNASLRLDRMNQCNSIKVVAPLISGELLNYALRIPPQFKQYDDNGTRIEKWIFRNAYEGILPSEITQRLKQEFSQGSGSAGVLPNYFEDIVSDDEFTSAKNEFPILRNKEEFYYFKIFTNHFGTKKAVDTVGQWISI